MIIPAKQQHTNTTATKFAAKNTVMVDGVDLLVHLLVSLTSMQIIIICFKIAALLEAGIFSNSRNSKEEEE